MGNKGAAARTNATKLLKRMGSLALVLSLLRVSGGHSASLERESSLRQMSTTFDTFNPPAQNLPRIHSGEPVLSVNYDPRL